jgi:hypothetical protein
MSWPSCCRSWTTACRSFPAGHRRDPATTGGLQADAADHPWLLDRVDALLEKNGMQDDEYLPPHDLLLA